MEKIRKSAGLFALLIVAICYVCFTTSAIASSEGGHEPAASVEHSTPAEGSHDAHMADAGAEEHGAAAGGHQVPNSLSAAKLKDLGWRIVNFIALMIILVKFAAKPIGSGLASRRKQIQDEIEDLENKRIMAQASYSEFKTKLASVESEIDKVVERAVAQAEVEKTKIIEKAESAAQDLKRSAEQAVQNEVTEARKVLKNEVAEQAAVIAQELIVKNLTAEDQVTIIENYLDKVGAVQ